MDTFIQTPEPEVETSESLMELHRKLVLSSAGEQDSYSLAQPSPLRYMPSLAADRTDMPPGNSIPALYPR